MTLTNTLLVIIAAMLFARFWPEQARALATIAIVVGLLYAVWWLIFSYPERRRRNKARAAQEAADEAQYREFQQQHKAIRRKFGPEHQWNEATSLPREYTEEMDALNAKYALVLARRLGDNQDE
jgi:type VI protein secretion system component VasK